MKSRIISKFKRFFYFLLFFPLFFACNNTSSFLSFQGATGSKTLFTAGTYTSVPDSYALSWKNGLKLELSTNAQDAKVFSTFVSNGKLYQAGYIGYKAVIWVNGVANFLTDGLTPSKVNSVFVVNEDVYAAGVLNGEAVFWKNGGIIKLSDTGISEANSIFVKDSDVYISGMEMNGGAAVAVLWKNPGPSLVKTELTDGSLNATAKSVTISPSGTVYVAGSEMNATNNVATLWIDGVKLELSDPTKDSSANVVAVFGGNVFVGGNDGTISKIWKNPGPSVETYSLSDGTHPSSVLSLFKNGESFYVAGFENNGIFNLAVLWQGGEKIILSSGNFDALISSVFVSEGDVYLGGHENYNEGSSSGSISFKGSQETLFGSNSEVRSIFVHEFDEYAAGSKDVGGVSKGAIWKNGVIVALKDNASFNSIVVNSEGDVFVGGRKDNLFAAVWKNIGAGEEEVVLSDGSLDAGVNSLFVEGSDIYAAGFDGREGIVWKNGLVFTGLLIGSGSDEVRFNSFFISEGVAYAGGFENISGVMSASLYNLTNEEKLVLDDSSLSSVRSIYVLGKDIFSVGFTSDGVSSRAVLWKNNIKTYLSSDTVFQARAESVVIDGEDVYVGGVEDFVGIVWKNGVRTVFGNKNPNSATKINSIFLK